jgi:hypothetical protein
LISGEAIIEILAHTRRVDIGIKSKYKFLTADWEQLTISLKNSFRSHCKEISAVRKQLEEWTLFVNPYFRLKSIVSILKKDLENLEINEPLPITENADKNQRKHYWKHYERWIDEITETQLLGTTLRMLAPVLAEAFINLVIFLFAKNEIKADKSLYESTIRKSIDSRVKFLSTNCEGFKAEIDSESDQFRNFLRLMNYRNDFLHGNINPKKLSFDKVYFDKDNTPLFKDEQSLQKRLLLNSLKLVEKDVALNDVRIVEKFTEFILSHMEEDYREAALLIMEDRNPGVRAVDKRVGTLFPSTISEGYTYSKK